MMEDFPIQEDIIYLSQSKNSYFPSLIYIYPFPFKILEKKYRDGGRSRYKLTHLCEDSFSNRLAPRIIGDVFVSPESLEEPRPRSP